MADVNMDQIVDQLSHLTVMQIATLTKTLEDKWGVKAAPVAVAGPAGGGAAPVAEKPPEQTEFALRAKLPRRHWIGLNDLLVSFGQNICHPTSPHCSTCPIARPCGRVGVRQSR